MSWGGSRRIPAETSHWSSLEERRGKYKGHREQRDPSLQCKGVALSTGEGRLGKVTHCGEELAKKN